MKTGQVIELYRIETDGNYLSGSFLPGTIRPGKLRYHKNGAGVLSSNGLELYMSVREREIIPIGRMIIKEAKK